MGDRIRPLSRLQDRDVDREGGRDARQGDGEQRVQGLRQQVRARLGQLGPRARDQLGVPRPGQRSALVPHSRRT